MIATLRLCTVCGLEFETRRPNQAVCSDSCRRRKSVLRSQNYQKNLAEVHTLRCIICGVEFHSPRKRKMLCPDPACKSKFNSRKFSSAMKTLKRRKLLDSKLLEDDEL